MAVRAMTLDWVSVAIGSVIGLAPSGLAWLALNSRYHQRVEDLKERVVDVEDKVAAHDHEINELHTHAAAFKSAAERIAESMGNQQRLWELQLGRLSDQLKSGQDVTNLKLEAVDRLATKDLEQLKLDLRAVKGSVDALRRPRTRSTSD